MLTHNDLIRLQPTIQKIAGDEDVVQETNLRLLERAGTIRAPDRYAACTAKRCRIDTASRRASVSLAEAAEPIDPSPLPDEVAATHEQCERLRAVVSELPQRQREAMLSSGRVQNSNRYQAVRSLRRMLAPRS